MEALFSQAHILEWLNLVVRWIHVIAAIMWIGDSFLFMWMDRSLEKRAEGADPAIVGDMWMVHSGGFYEVTKRKYLDKDRIPKVLHWFKWEAGITWISGFFLLVIVYYAASGVYLTDPKVATLTHGQAVAISLALLVAGFGLYDVLWSSPLKRFARPLQLLCFGLLLAAAYLTTHLFSGRAAFLQLGAMMGTVMAANVWMRILPAQRALIAATHAGTTPDVSLGLRAKLRSTHNHYMTLPLLFTMLSNHFPSTYSHPQAWIVFGLICVFAASVKQLMIDKGQTHPVILAALVLSLGTGLWMTKVEEAQAAIMVPPGPPVAFSEARAIVDRRCISCHAEHPTNPSFPVAPIGIMLDTDERLRSLAPRVRVRAVTQATMPLGNLTGMTDEERVILGRWVDQGAH